MVKEDKIKDEGLKCVYCGGPISPTHKRLRCLKCHRTQPGNYQVAGNHPEREVIKAANLAKGTKRGAW